MNSQQNIDTQALKGQTSAFFMADMDCPTEEGLIRAKLADLPGIIGLEFNLLQRKLIIHHQANALQTISVALDSLALGATLLDMETATSSVIPKTHIPWRKLTVAGVFALAAEMYELTREWGGAPFGLQINSWQIGNVATADYLPLILAVIAILLAGFETYKNGWRSIKNLNLNINALMSVAVTGAVLIGQFPEAAMVMVLFNLAEAIEANSLNRAREAIKNLLNLTPEKITIQRQDGTWAEMDINQAAIGSLGRVKPGERVALDGVIVKGQSTVNQAPITGESLPVEKSVGDQVYAGSINESGSFEFKVTAKAADSTLARIIRAVEEAQGSRAPTQHFVDHFAKYYTPAIFMAAGLTALILPLFMGGVWTDWIYKGLILLVIGCPCALVISTPVTIVSGMAAAAKKGILIKGGTFLEMGRQLGWLALDKTGTITHGKPVLTDFFPLADSANNELSKLPGLLGANEIVAVASSLAARSDHPVSRAIAENATQNNIPLLEVNSFAAIPGQGVQGHISGQDWRLGNRKMVEESGNCSPDIEQIFLNLEQQGKSVVALLGQSSVQGLFAVADTIRESSLEAVLQLKKLGVRAIMLTGDNQHTANIIAKQAGIDECCGNLLPEDKLLAIAQLKQQIGPEKKKRSRIGMVGDGINDAPALATADIGFAMGAIGSDAAIETADVALMDDDLRKISHFIRLSKFTHSLLVQNISLALGIKLVFFILTFLGCATMWMAVFADVGASLLVVANGLRAIKK